MYLGLDLGTTNVKALVTDRAGQCLSEAACPVQLFQGDDGRVEQDIEEIWHAAVSAIREAIRPHNPGAIHAVGVSSQGGAMQLLSSEGQPLGRVISWLDRRAQPLEETLTKELGTEWFARRVGHGRAALAIGQVLRLRQESPALISPPNRIGFVGDIIVSRLCGRAAQDGTSCGLTVLYNPARRDYDPDVLGRLGLAREQLPELLSPRKIAGGLSRTAAQATGLPPATPVSAPVHDQYASALATGVVSAGTVMVGTGTAWVLLAVTDKPCAPITPTAFACHHLVDGLWGQILSLAGGGSALAWALELTGHNGKNVSEIDDLMGSAPPGSDGVHYSHFHAGTGPAISPSHSQSGLSGVRLLHRPGHLIRAVVEGLAFELGRQIGLLREAGLPVRRLVLTGSAASSRVTPQIIASVTGLPVACVTRGGGSPLGAAILARGLLEPASSLVDLASQMGPPARDFEPGRSASFYHERFNEYLRSLPEQAHLA